MLLQHREYQLVAGTCADFVDAWRRSVVPLRARHGFVVVGAWAAPEEDRFVWVVGHPDDFEAAQSAYYADPKRTGMDPDPSAMVLEARVVMVDPV